MYRRFLISSLACILTASAQERVPVDLNPPPDQGEPTVKPSVEKIGDSRYRIGKVTFDKESREIRFPAQVNMIEGLLEFLVVHQKGKLHESLFSTEISPLHLNLAFKLLGFPVSPELYPVPGETPEAPARFPEVAADIKAAARIRIDAEWEVDGKTRRLPVNEMIQHEVKTTAMPAGPWVYGGSGFNDGKYVPETTGDIVAIFLTMSALVNFPGEDNGDDTVWIPFPKRVPPEGTPVTLIITPDQKKPSAPEK